MFRNGLLISTAMTAVALLLSPVQHAAAVQTDMRAAPRNANARFVCTYGHFLVSAFSLEGSGYFASSWTHVAVPIIGHGQTVTSIRVIEARGSATSTPSFTAGIYSNNPSGFPGHLIAGGKGRITGTACAPITISIAPTKLKRRTKYWVEETDKNQTSSQPSNFYWQASPKTRRRAYVQHHWYKANSSSHSSSTLPWTEQSAGPYLKLK